MDFQTSNSNIPQTLTVRADVPGTKQGLHYATIQQFIDGASLDGYLALALSDVTTALATAINKDTSRDPAKAYTATASGGTLTITSPSAFAFSPGDFFSSLGGATIDATHSVLSTSVIATPMGTVTAGEIWTLTLDGTPYVYTAAAGNSLADVAAAAWPRRSTRGPRRGPVGRRQRRHGLRHQERWDRL